METGDAMPIALRLTIATVVALFLLASGGGIVWLVAAVGCAFLAPRRGRGADVGFHMGVWWGVIYLVFLAMQKPTGWTALGEMPSRSAIDSTPGGRRFD